MKFRREHTPVHAMMVHAAHPRLSHAYAVAHAMQQFIQRKAMEGAAAETPGVQVVQLAEDRARHSEQHRQPAAANDRPGDAAALEAAPRHEDEEEGPEHGDKADREGDDHRADEEADLHRQEEQEIHVSLAGL